MKVILAGSFIDLVLKVKPTQVALIADNPIPSSNAGWDVKAHFDQLSG